MKKPLLSITLALTIVSLWAFSSPQPHSVTYMEVVLSSGTLSTIVTVITPDGKATKTEAKGHDSTEARGKMIIKLNDLSKSGWHVVRLNNSGQQDGYIREVYFLEK